MKKDSDPTELVSCGKCGKVNTVPFGLDKFKCYGCGSLVLVSREMSAACAAASSTAVYYNDLEVPKPSPSGNNTRSTGAANLGSDSLTPEAPKKEPVGFFGKLQQKMDKTMQKVDKTFQNLTTTQPPPVPQKQLQPSVAPLVSKHPPLPAMSSEEQQLQWALNASLSDSRASPNLASSCPPGVMMGRPPNAPGNTATPSDTLSHMASSASAGDQLQAAATNVAQKLQGTEERAALAEKELAKALEREAQGLAQREELRRQLDDNESIIKGLTEQIDSANLELEAKVKHCHALENALVQAQQMADQAADSLVGEGSSELERQGTVAQLLARIAELESTLLRATHFAPEENDGITSSPPMVSSCGPAEESSACAVSVNESETIVGTRSADVASSKTISEVETVPTELPVSSSTQEPSILDGNSCSVPSVPIIEPSVAADSVATREDALADIVFDPVPSVAIAKDEPKEDALKDLTFDPPPRLQENEVKPTEGDDGAKSVDSPSEAQLQDPSSQLQDPSREKELQDPNGEASS